MSTNTNNPIAKAVKLALLAGFATAIAAPAAYAAETEEEVERIEVTGSRIKRTDVEGANPVVSISREDLNVQADTNVADFVQSLTQNTFGSPRPTSGSGQPGQATVDLRGLGSARTLVLINGRRMAGSPVLGNGAQNLSTIPMAAVERIEVLADGASAIYGSEAIGGVLNIILRKDFEGVEVTAYRSKTTEEGGDVESGSIVGGSAFEKGNFVYAIDFERKDIIFQKDRDVTFLGDNNVSTTGPYGSFRRLNANWRNNFDQDPTNDIASHYASGETINPNCPDDLLNPQATASRCGYRYPFNAASDTDQKRVGGFFGFNYEINSDWTLSSMARIATFDDFGRYAPAPFTFGTDIRLQNFGGVERQLPVVVLANDPRNPTYGTANPVDVSVNRVRPLALGNRDEYSDNTQIDFVTGVSGTIGDYSIDGGVQFNRHRVMSRGYNYALKDAFRRAIESGVFDPFNPANNSSEDTASFNTTILTDAETNFKAADLSVSGDLFEMPAGALSFAVGSEYRDEEYRQDHDNQSNAGNVFGSSGGSSEGGRTVTSLFTELNIPVVEGLEFAPAVRYDSYNDVGSKTTWKVSGRWQALDNLVLRGAVGTGFRAPTLDDLLAAPSEGYPSVTDPATNLNTQYLQTVLSNPNLKPEQSDHLNFGVVYEPIDNLSFSMDYYKVEIEDVITTLDISGLLALESAGMALPAPTDIIRDGCRIAANGPGGCDVNGVTPALDGVIASGVNSGILETSGVDFTTNYKVEIGGAGTLGVNLVLTHVFDYIDNPVSGFDDEDDGVGFAGLPENKANFTIDWTMGDHKFAYMGEWIDSTKWTTRGNAIAGDGVATPFTYDCTASFSDDGRGNGPCDTYGSYYKYGMQYSWTAPWNASIAVGGKNMANRLPVGNGHYTRGYDTMYDLIGREYYVRYTQRF